MLKHAIKRAAGLFMSDGVSSNLRYLNRKKLLALYYHRVVDRDEIKNVMIKNMCVDVDSFRAQMEFLAKHYKPVGEKSIIKAACGEEELPDNPVWVTFDDGFKDTYTAAYPVLKKYGIAATVFVATGFINRICMACEDYIVKAAEMSKVDRVDFSVGARRYNIPLDSAASRRRAIKELLGLCECGGLDKDRLLGKLVDAFHISYDQINDLFMDWDELKEMSSNGIFIGAHTVYHKRLSTLTSDEIRTDILSSKNEIEKRLGREVKTFAYPLGKRRDYNFETCLPILKECGFSLAVSTIGGNNFLESGDDLLNLRRVGISYNDTLSIYKMKVSAGSFWQT